MKNSESRSLSSQIGRASVVIVILTMADKIMAIGKEMLTAKRFGISSELDVFNVAHMFPGTLILIFSGALVLAFVPLYLEWTGQLSRQDADSHATWLIYLTAAFFAVLTLICFFLSPLIIRLLGYGFGSKERQLGIMMVRLLILLIFIDGAGILFRGILQARKMFFHLYVAPIFVNITIIFFLLYGMGIGIYVLVWGFLIGTLLKTIYMGMALHREGFNFGTALPFDRQKMKAMWLLALPMMGSQMIALSNVVIDQVMATNLPEGSVSTLRYAFRINDLPIQVVIMTISMAIFPFISEEVAVKNYEKLRDIYIHVLIFLGFLTIPITCLIVLFSEDIVIILFKRGAFDLEASKQTAQVLFYYSLGLFFYAYTFVNGSFFAALKNTKALLNMGIASVFLNVFFNIVFMHLMGVKGIALSTSVTMGIVSMYFIFLLKGQMGITDLLDILSSFYRIILAAACMLGIGFLLLRVFQMVTTERWIYLPVTGTVVCIAYLGVIWIFLTEDPKDPMNRLIRMVNNLWKEKF